MRTHVHRVFGGVYALLVVFALGLLATSVLLDVAGLALRQTLWADAARRDLQLGLAGSAAAGLFAVASVTRSLPGSRTRRMTLLRAAAHLASLALFAGALVVRGAPFPSNTALVLSAAGLALGALGAWLGAEIAAGFDRP